MPSQNGDDPCPGPIPVRGRGVIHMGTGGRSPLKVLVRGRYPQGPLSPPENLSLSKKINQGSGGGKTAADSSPWG